MNTTTENTTDPAVLYDALDKQGRRLRAAWADADHLRAVLKALLPYVIGPEDEDSPGYSHAVSEAINASKIETQRRIVERSDNGAHFAEAARIKETLAEIIPALEVASKCKADELRATCPGNELTPDEWAALWMARAILEADSLTRAMSD